MLIAPAIAQAQVKSGFEPSLAGLQIIESQARVSKRPRVEIDLRKQKYREFVNNTVAFFKNKYGNPTTDIDLKELSANVVAYIWKSFKFEPTDLLVASWDSTRLDWKDASKYFADPRPSLDCDTSAYLMADILKHFLVKSTLIVVPEHVVLHASIPASSIFIETTQTESFTFYSSYRELRVFYPFIHGESGLAPNDFLNLEIMALHQFDNQDFHGALENINQAIQQNSNIAGLHYTRGIINLKLDKFEQAVRDFTSAIHINTKKSDIYWKQVLKDLGSVVNQPERARRNVKLFSVQSANAYSGRGRARMAQSKFAEAKDDMDIALTMDSSDDARFYDLGNVEVELKHYEDAIKSFSRAISLSKKPMYFYSRGTAFYLLMQYENAAKDYSVVIGLQPTNWEAYYCRGVNLFMSKNYDLAIRDFERALQLHPEDQDALQYLNRAKKHSDPKH